MKITKRFTSLLTGSFFILLLAACSQEETPQGDKLITLTVATPQISEGDETTESNETIDITRSGSTSTPFTQTVTVPAGNGMTLEATLEPSPKAATRGSTMLGAGVKYRIIAFAQDNVTTTGYKSHADFVAGTTEAVAGNLNVSAGATYTFVCYSLNTASLPAFDQNSLDITAAPSTDDLLYVKFNQAITESSKTLSFSFKRQFSQVTVISDATDMAQNITAMSADLSPNYSATLNMSTGALTAGTALARSIPWGTITPGQTVTAIPCMVFANGHDGVSFSIPSVTIGGTTETDLTATFGSTKLQPGYKYTLRLKFKVVLIGGITVAGLTWAPGNLIGTSDGNGGWTYSFAATQEYYSGKVDGGDYWGWCQLDPTVTTAYSGGYSISVDPCQKVAPAGTWRTPTQTELENLVASGSVWTTKNGMNGRYFGTSDAATAAASPNSYVFLPAAGYRSDGSSTSHHVGTDATYWSATPSGTAAAYLIFTSAVVIPTSSSSRNYGFTVRCVK